VFLQPIWKVTRNGGDEHRADIKGQRDTSEEKSELSHNSGRRLQLGKKLRSIYKMALFRKSCRATGVWRLCYQKKSLEGRGSFSQRGGTTGAEVGSYDSLTCSRSRENAGPKYGLWEYRGRR